MQTITLQKLIADIKFHGENICIDSVHPNSNVSSFGYIANGLSLTIVETYYGSETINYYFNDWENEEIIPNSDGVYRLIDTQKRIHSIKFFLAISNLADTTS